ncbi:MAG TPA: hypothetical protein VHG90_00615 [Acidimicrobiales bacterium]|nr:hypothetical protein [Acidimicrobiales bacterium]
MTSADAGPPPGDGPAAAGGGVALGAEELAYRARALAQTHPLTPLAKRYLDQAVAVQRTSQPVPEIGVWAGASLLCGYCLRRVEEDGAGLRLQAVEEGVDLPDHEQLDQAAAQIAAELRTDDAGGHLLSRDPDAVIDALDRIIFSEVRNRLDHWKDSIDQKAWEELEEYITWWVVKGYALRVAERRLGVLA